MSVGLCVCLLRVMIFFFKGKKYKRTKKKMDRLKDGKEDRQTEKERKKK